MKISLPSIMIWMDRPIFVSLTMQMRMLLCCSPWNDDGSLRLSHVLFGHQTISLDFCFVVVVTRMGSIWNYKIISLFFVFVPRARKQPGMIQTPRNGAGWQHRLRRLSFSTTRSSELATTPLALNITAVEHYSLFPTHLASIRVLFQS